MPGPAGGAVVSLGFWEFEGKDPPSAAPVGGPRRVLTRSQRESGAGLGRQPPPLRPAANRLSGPQTPKCCSSVAHPPGSSRVSYLEHHPRLQGRGSPAAPGPRGAAQGDTSPRPGVPRQGPAPLTWQRQTMSASWASRSTTFPLPSSPHCAPSTTVTRFPPGGALGRPQSPLGREEAAAGLLSEIDMAPVRSEEP